MRRSLIILAVLLLIGSLCRADGTMINSYRYVAAGGGGTLLVGDNTSRTLDTTTLLNPDYAIYGVYTATASGTVAKGYAHIDPTTADNAKMVIWNNSTGTIIATSASVAIEAEAVYEFAFSAGSITASTVYAVGIICDGYVNIAHDSQSWQLGYESNSYTTPAAIDPGEFAGRELGRPQFYITH